MNHKSRDRREYFNVLSPEWDARAADQNRLKKALSMLSLQSADRVADIGCGTGILIPFIKSAIGTDGRILCIDFAYQMLRRARRNHRTQGIHYITADGEKLPIKDNYFNQVICLAVFAHFSNQKTALMELLRVLCPGGTLSVIHLLGSKELRTVHQRAGGPIKNDFLPPSDRLTSMFSDAGFHSIRIIDEPDLFFVCSIK